LSAAAALIAHPGVRAISFVGSEPVVRAVYRDAAAQGKRVQALGSASGLIERMQAAAAALKVGPGDQPGVEVGPLIRDEHRRRVIEHIDRAEHDGPRVITDGRAYRDRPGCFLGPTVIDGVERGMAVGHDEIFGPVLSVTRASTLDAAIEQANSMVLGHMAVIFTESHRSF
jgi:malonate-semialdehyde dehydrogenase (acetylating)/methylmalonate-semialdehyde dehydrogenase